MNKIPVQKELLCQYTHVLYMRMPENNSDFIFEASLMSLWLRCISLENIPYVTPLKDNWRVS